MLRIGQEVFLFSPSEQRRRFLHPAKIVGVVDDQFHIELEEGDFEIETDQELIIYYHVARDFVKQPASVVGDVQTEPEHICAIRVSGQPVSADSRECYRVSTVISGHAITFGKETDCHILDASATGFAISATQEYFIANVVNATLVHDGVEYVGRLCVQSIRELKNGRIRYGASCVDKVPIGNNLLAGAQQFSLAMQREQARRLAGAS